MVRFILLFLQENISILLYPNNANLNRGNIFGLWLNWLKEEVNQPPTIEQNITYC